MRYGCGVDFHNDENDDDYYYHNYQVNYHFQDCDFKDH